MKGIHLILKTFSGEKLRSKIVFNGAKLVGVPVANPNSAVHTIATAATNLYSIESKPTGDSLSSWATVVSRWGGYRN